MQTPLHHGSTSWSAAVAQQQVSVADRTSIAGDGARARGRGAGRGRPDAVVGGRALLEPARAVRLRRGGRQGGRREALRRGRGEAGPSAHRCRTYVRATSTPGGDGRCRRRRRRRSCRRAVAAQREGCRRAGDRAAVRRGGRAVDIRADRNQDSACPSRRGCVGRSPLDSPLPPLPPRRRLADT